MQKFKVGGKSKFASFKGFFNRTLFVVFRVFLHRVASEYHVKEHMIRGSYWTGWLAEDCQTGKKVLIKRTERPL